MTAYLTLLLCAIAAPDRPDLTPKYPMPNVSLFQQIQGQWLMVSNSFSRQPAKAAPISDRVMVFHNDKMHIGTRSAKLPEKFAYGFRIDASRNPATFDIIYQTGKGITLLGICKIEGDQLTLCLALSGGNRPTTFGSNQQGRTALWVLTRVKK